MLFNPAATIPNWDLTLGVFVVIFIGKPLAALGIVVLLGYPLRTALAAAMALGPDRRILLYSRGGSPLARVFD